MSATYTLASTNFAAPVAKDATQVYVASKSGLAAGMRLYSDRECMAVVSLHSSANLVNVRRGVDSTRAQEHGTDVTVWVATPDQLYDHDPQGRPREDLLVSPFINVLTGDVWFAQGDAAPIGTGQRWWQKQVIGHTIGDLGTRITTPDPSSSN